MKLLVTGCLGFIGLNFVKQYHRKYEMVGIDKQSYASNDVSLLPPDVPYIHADINSVNKLNIATDFDWIVHFAAETHVDNAIYDATPFWDSNVKGTYELAMFAIRHKIKFFHISTDEVFGEWRQNEPEFNEQSPYWPNNMYSVSKAASDQIVRGLHRSHKLDYIITNCGNNYGPHQHSEKFIPKVQSGKKVYLHSQGRPIRDWIHVYDHCSAIDLLLNDGVVNESYVVGARDAHSIKWICDTAGVDYTLTRGRPGVDIGYKLDPAKLEDLGWKPDKQIKDYL